MRQNHTISLATISLGCKRLVFKIGLCDCCLFDLYNIKKRALSFGKRERKFLLPIICITTTYSTSLIFIARKKKVEKG
jgi:hypothetical protein